MWVLTCHIFATGSFTDNILMEIICSRFQGCIYPAMYAIWSRWAPPLERAKLVTIPHSGKLEKIV